jgi:branched-chain amino acid transport system substrate-binding protein
MMLWAEAVRKADTLDRDKVIEVLESGISVEGPSGTVTVDPKTHHAVLNMYLAEVRGSKFEIKERWENQVPVSDDARCDLIANPDTNQQFPVEL